MDTSDPDIQFDAAGICNRCKRYEFLMASRFPPGADKKALLDELVAAIKHEGRNNEYDCVIGVSGGVDSTYVAYIVKNLGLRPLAVHLDNGWDAELAVANIEKCMTRLGIDLYTHVLDWDEFRELQLAFLKSSTPDSEAPTDQAIVAALRWKAVQENVRYLIMGNNVATEGIGVTAWSMGQNDWRYIRSVNRMFGTGKLKTYPRCTLLQNMYIRYVKGQRTVEILDYVDYNKELAIQTLSRELGYVRYAGKHNESVYTRFYQSYILPRKFGADKRRIHLSTLIMDGQITRDQALHEMTREIMPAEQVREDKVFVAKKLGLTEREFDEIMALPRKSFWDYPSYERLAIVRLRRFVIGHLAKRRASRAADVPLAEPVAQ